MAKPFDGSFFFASFLVLAALGLAWAAVTRDELPIIGTGGGALIAVGIVGLAGCAVGGIGAVSMPPDWTSPTMLTGTVLGLLAFGIVVAGLLGWSGVFQPVAQLVPGHAATWSTAQLATVALAALIALKWVIATVLAVTRAA